MIHIPWIRFLHGGVDQALSYFGITHVPLRKGALDDVNTSVQEIFGGHLTGKAIECTKPCLELLLKVVAKEDCLTKDALKTCKQSVEEANLIATAMADGVSFRANLEVVSEFLGMVFSFMGPDHGLPEKKYQSIRDAKTCESRPLHEFESAITALYTRANLAEQVNMKDLVDVRAEFIKSGKESYAEFRQSFTENLTASMVTNVQLPPVVDSVTSVDMLTQEFLDKHFDMKASERISNQTIKMTTLLRDIKVACSHMGVNPGDFIDNFASFEINSREGLGYL